MAGLTKGEAIEQVQKALSNTHSSFDLVPFSKFKRGKKLRSDRYNSFHVLCYANTHKQAGWLVCNYAVSGCCELDKAILAYNPTTGGTGRLERHMNSHKAKSNTLALPKPMKEASKATIARSAALAVALDLRPISFTDDQEGMSYFVDAIFHAGQLTAPGDVIDSKSILPCGKSVSSALSKLADDNRSEYKSLLPGMIKTGGGVTTDGVTLKVQDKQFYDLTLHYMQVLCSSQFDPAPTFRISCKTLLLQEKKGEANAEQIRKVLGDALQSQYGCDIDVLTKGFTMVTDNASVMARVARSSVSTRVAPLTERWMGCLVHQINTAMKGCISESANHEELSNIFDDVQGVKKIVRIFKQSNWNSMLPQGFKLIQEVETRFGTTFQVVQRFLKSFSHVQDIIASKDSLPAKHAYENLKKSVSASGEIGLPALEAVIDAFKTVMELQTKLQASKTPTLHIALIGLKQCTDKLQSIVDGGSVYRGDNIGFVPSPRLSRQLCRSIIEWLDAKVRIHPLLMAGCYLNPLFREFQFIDDITKRRTYRNGGEAMIRSLIPHFLSEGHSNTVSTVLAPQECSVSPTETDSQPAVAGRKRTFSLLEYADSHFQPLSAVDEVSRYNCMDISQLPIDRAKFMRDDFCAVRFWYMHRSTFPLLYKVALRLYAIPVSSCSSERVFSAVNRVVTRDRASMTSKTLEEIIVVRSLVSDK